MTKTSTPTLPAAPKPRVDRQPDAYLARVVKAIKTDDKVTPYLDCQVTGDVKIVTTDGHRMVLVEGTGAAQRLARPFAFLSERPTTRFALEPAFHSVLRRMKAAAPDKKDATVTLRLEPNDDGKTATLRLTVHNLNDGIDATEDLTVFGEALRKAETILNIRFVDDVLGRWPTFLRLGAPTAAVLFENDVLTYVLMPFTKANDTAPADVDVAQSEPWLTVTVAPGELAPRIGEFFVGAVVRKAKREGTVTALTTIKAKGTRQERQRACVKMTDAKGRVFEQWVDLDKLTLVDEQPETLKETPDSGIPNDAPVTADREGEEKRVERITDAELVLAENAYSADRIGENGKRPVKVFRLNGHLYTSVGASRDDVGPVIESYELVSREAFAAAHPTIPIDTYTERSARERRGAAFYPGMIVFYEKREYVLDATRILFYGGAAKAAPAPSRSVSAPPAPKPTSTPSAPGVPQRWAYSWVDKNGPVSGEVEAVTEKLARASIRAKHGFPQWLPDRTKVTCLGPVATAA